MRIIQIDRSDWNEDIIDYEDEIYWNISYRY